MERIQRPPLRKRLVSFYKRNLSRFRQRRYTHKIAISNSRILSVTDSETTFSARAKNPGGHRRQISLKNEEFIRRFLMHVLPHGFQRIRYYGFLNNRMKSKNLKLIFKLQGYQRFIVNGRKMVLHTTSSFFATIPLKNNHMGGFHDHDRQNT